MDDDLLETRRGLTFAQAEGLAPLPQQLALGVLSREVRIRLDAAVTAAVDETSTWVHSKRSNLSAFWLGVLRDYNRHILFNFDDEVDLEAKRQVAWLRDLFRAGSYADVLTFVQFLLGYSSPGGLLRRSLVSAFVDGRAAYRVLRDLVVPVTSEAEGRNIRTAFDQLRQSNLPGAEQHLANAAAMLTSGDWAGSVRESIQAVESVARKLSPESSTLGPALSRLREAHTLHPALTSGMEKLYGYTNTEEGIRHALLNAGTSAVDEADALYMFGACAAFVTFLLSKAKAASI